MILDDLINAERYYSLHDGFRPAFEFLRQLSPDKSADGRHTLDGENIFALLSRQDGKTKEEARLEAHLKYIDIQYLITGTESIGWKARAECTHVSDGYDSDKDIEFFPERPAVWITLHPGMFAIFYPEDAHAPLVSDAAVHKVVMKIAVSERS